MYKIISVSAVYALATHFDKASAKLAELVTADMQQGWKPLGGVAVGDTQSTKEPYLFQAMIKE